MVLLTTMLLKGGMGYFGHSIDPLSSCLFLMMTVAIIEDYIFICHLIRIKKYSYKEASLQIIVPSFLTSLTTSIGFASLMIDSPPSVFHFALWTSLGAMFQWVLMFLIFPAFLLLFPKIEGHYIFSPSSFPILGKITNVKPRKWLSLILSIIPFYLIVNYNHANLNFSPYDLFDNDHSVSVFRHYMVNSKKAEGDVSLVFEHKKTDATEILNKVRQHDMTAKILSEEDFQKTIQYLPVNLHNMVLEDFKKSDIGQLFFSKQKKRAFIYLKSIETDNIEMFEKDINNICQGECRVISEIVVSKDYSLGLLRTLYKSFALSFLLIMSILAWLALSTDPKNLFAVLLSSLWAPTVLLIGVIIFQLKINVVTCVALSVLVGLTGDNAIQFLLFNQSKLKDSIKEIGVASVQTLILMISLISVLFFAYFKTPKILAVLMLIGVLFMLIGDIWILNGFLRGQKDENSEANTKD